MSQHTPSQDCPDCGRFVQDRPNQGLSCECGWTLPRTLDGNLADQIPPEGSEGGTPLPEWMAAPDVLHRRGRDCIDRAREGTTLDGNAYGVEPGDRIRYRYAVYTVAAVTRWNNNAGHTLSVVDPAGAGYTVRVPWNVRRGSFQVLAPGDHRSVCVDCGDPWPCREIDEAREAERGAEQAVARFEHDAEHPWTCPWCARFHHGESRFKTERGMRQHTRCCHANPANWDLDRWIPVFEPDLRIRGGFTPGDGGVKARARAVLVRDAALNGRLPATLAELETTPSNLLD